MHRASCMCFLSAESLKVEPLDSSSTLSQSQNKHSFLLNLNKEQFHGGLECRSLIGYSHALSLLLTPDWSIGDLGGPSRGMTEDKGCEQVQR